jgi:hypothetical protein
MKYSNNNKIYKQNRKKKHHVTSTQITLHIFIIIFFLPINNKNRIECYKGMKSTLDTYTSTHTYIHSQTDFASEAKNS